MSFDPALEFQVQEDRCNGRLRQLALAHEFVNRQRRRPELLHDPLGRLRGRVHRLGSLNLPVIVTYHPAYLLRTPADKRKAWEDLKLARRVFGELAASSAPS